MIRWAGVDDGGDYFFLLRLRILRRRITTSSGSHSMIRWLRGFFLLIVKALRSSLPRLRISRLLKSGVSIQILSSVENWLMLRSVEKVS